MNCNYSERLSMMIVAFDIGMPLLSLPNVKKTVNSGKRHVTKANLRPIKSTQKPSQVYAEILRQNKSFSNVILPQSMKVCGRISSPCSFNIRTTDFSMYFQIGCSSSLQKFSILVFI